MRRTARPEAYPEACGSCQTRGPITGVVRAQACRADCGSPRPAADFTSAHRGTFMPYNVYLVDITDRIGSDQRRDVVKATLQSYFGQISKAAKLKDGVLVSFVTEPPKIEKY